MQVFQGSTYYIILATVSSGSKTAAVLNCVPKTYDLPNDECTGALPINDGWSSYDGTKATTPQTVVDYLPYRDQWFKYTATCTGLLTISLPLVTTIPYSGNQVVRTQSECNTTSYVDIYSGETKKRQVVEGAVLYIAAGYATTSTFMNSSSFLFISCIAPPANDLKANATRITGLGPFSVTNTDAKSHECMNDVWYDP